jgi:hypothetical protein
MRIEGAVGGKPNWIWVSCCGLVVLLGLQTTDAAVITEKKKDGGKRTQAAEALFAGGEVLRIKIEIPEEGVKKLEEYQWQFGEQQMERESVPVTVREGKNVYTNVALRLKGSAGSFRPVTENPAMTLNFDKFVDGQHFHGLDKLSLNNSVQDPTYLSEQFSRELFLKAGVPTPRATQVVAELNGRDLGVYVLVEGWNRQFLKRHFKNTKGNLYDGGFLRDITQELSTNSGENPKDQSDRQALVDAANEPDLMKRLERLDKVLDLERFLSYVALEVMLWDWDGYPIHRNNWRLYHDLDTGKMVFMPHGLDQMLWKPEEDVLPPMEGLVAKAVLGIPELRQRYIARMKQLRASLFQVNELTNRVQTIATRIRPLLAAQDAKLALDHDKSVNALCAAIERRARSLDQQLSVPIEPLQFDGSGVAALRQWESVEEFGSPELSQGVEPKGEKVLKIGVKQGSSIGFWSTSVRLEPGRYQIEGRVKIDGLVPDPGDTRGGAGLRLDKRPSTEYLAGNVGWTNLSTELKVDGALRKTQIVCEFRGAEGQACFDLESLRIRRLAEAEPARK